MRSRALIACFAVIACTKQQREREPTTTAQPLWAATATQPTVARAGPRALLLLDGRVLVTGGGTAATELFQPAAETWSLGPPLSQPHTGNVLELFDGRPLSLADSDAELYTGAAWQPLAPPLTPRTGATGVTLADGRLVVIGGQVNPQSQVERLELDAGWSPLPSTTAAHFGHTATLLPNGNIAVVGGPTDTAELFDGATWSTRAGPERYLHTASLLPGGELLLVGGRTLLDGGITGAERYDPVTGARAPVPGLRVPRLAHAASPLPSGDVLITGGEGPAAARSAERYLSALDRFVAAGCLETPRSQHAGAVLLDGGVVLVGGLGLDGGALARAEKLDLSTGLLAQGSTCAFDCECATGFCAGGVCCDSACNGGPCETCGTGACQLAGNSTVCRGAAGACDLDERCTSDDAGCPPDLRATAATSCRNAQGPCDLAELCDGTNPQCPADLFAGAGLGCRNAQGLCDVAEACDGLQAQCPTDRFADAGTSCRPATLSCDRAETCSGTSSACPADTVLDAGAVCRAAQGGGCDVAEVCDGTTTVCPADRVADAGTTCRAADAGCDLAESCNGASATCPADSVAAPGVPCRPSSGPCDVAEFCLGARACPADAVRDAGTRCRDAGTVCDAPDLCDGVVAACADSFAPPSTSCRPAAGVCDAPELCTGASSVCPGDSRVDAGVECRAAAAACDEAEACDGVATACPPDAVALAATPCRAPAGACDRVEVCDGLTASCPADQLLDAGALCRSGVGPCDAPEECTGASADCPFDRVSAAGTLCRPSAGSCDIAETCTGDAGLCPADTFAAATNVCRPAAMCDVEERCSGTAAQCPPDVTAACTEPPPKHYVGWNCASADGLAPLLALLVLVGLRRKKALALAACTLGSAARAEPAITSDFSIRLSASLLRDLLAPQVGAEVGANVSLTRSFDLGGAVSIGRAFGARAGVTWHMRDDGEWVRPFVQARALVHPVPEGIAGGGGAWAGIFVPVGPGRIQAGALFEAYLGPAGYLPYDAFVTIGYELDVYRRIERKGELPAPDFGGSEVGPLKKDEPPPTPEESPAPPKEEQPPPQETDRTRVVTRVSLAKDMLFYEERRQSWMSKSDPTVRKVIEVLKRYPQLQRVEIDGHADDMDTDDECVQLSLKRAERVLEELLRAGIEPTRLTARGWGKLKNRAPTTGPARKRESNRRVDFTVLQENW